MSDRSFAATNHRGQTPHDVIADEVDGCLERSNETAARILTALDEAGFMVVSQEYAG